ncbi:MAG TPA: hypothetical protein VGM56_30225, partial [Byssovorax sp.]
NEKVLAAIAQESNGHHYFVENDAALERAFEREAEALTSTVASEAEVKVDLPDGVELDRVFDRSFHRAGGSVVVPLGSFSAAETKTVLLRVRAPRAGAGSMPMATVAVAYKDLSSGAVVGAKGELVAEALPSGAAPGDLDAVVASRVQRSETALVLKEANTLFEQGRFDEASRKVAAQESSLRAFSEKAAAAAPAPKRRAVAKDLDNQLQALGSSGFATPPTTNASPFASPPRPAPAQDSREGRGAVRRNQERVNDLAL